jgi:hypothetical protein
MDGETIRRSKEDVANKAGESVSVDENRHRRSCSVSEFGVRGVAGWPTPWIVFLSVVVNKLLIRQVR